jgi:hypothetical protein
MHVTAVWLLIVAAAGTLLLAVVAEKASRIKAWQRPAAPSFEDLIYAAGQRYRLDASQREAVRQAVSQGRQAPAELREAAFAVATGLRATLPPGRPIRDRWPMAVWLAVLLLAWLTVHATQDDYFAGFMVPVMAILLGGGVGLLTRRRRRRAERAAALNRPVEMPVTGSAGLE